MTAIEYNTHDLGNTVRVRATFTDPNNNDALLDPTVVKLSIRPPGSGVTTHTYPAAPIIKLSTGVYYADIDANLAGDWFYRWWSTGTGKAAAEKYFYVKGATAVE